jgi:orotate phosphoribosyltransferase
MKKKQVLDIFNNSGALLKGHFLLTSGIHSAQYLQCALVLQNPGYAALLGAEIAERFRPENADVVVSPAVGGIIVGYEVARALGINAIFAEREAGAMVLRRGFSLPEGSKVIVVEDVTTTGGSVVEIIKLVTASNCRVVGVGAIVDRSGGKVDFGVRFESLITLDIATYPPEACPLCKDGVPLVKHGSRNIK